jgi:hypothetical protein
VSDAAGFTDLLYVCPVTARRVGQSVQNLATFRLTLAAHFRAAESLRQSGGSNASRDGHEATLAGACAIGRAVRR